MSEPASFELGRPLSKSERELLERELRAGSPLARPIAELERRLERVKAAGDQRELERLERILALTRILDELGTRADLALALADELLDH